MTPKALRSHIKSLNQNDPATHYVLAWRIPLPRKGTLIDHFQPLKDQQQQRGPSIDESKSTTSRGDTTSLQSGSDDDGEQHGGRHVLSVLEQDGVQGSLVVARWYGGK